jgi:hypothetical protein
MISMQCSWTGSRSGIGRGRDWFNGPAPPQVRLFNLSLLKEAFGLAGIGEPKHRFGRLNQTGPQTVLQLF